MELCKFFIFCLQFLLLLIFNALKVSSVQVIQFEQDGVARLDTLAVYRGVLDPGVRFQSVSFCTRIKIYFLHGRDTFFQLHDNSTNNRRVIRGEIFLDKARPVFMNQWQFQLFPKKLKTFRWYHMCFTYDASKSLYLTFIDGEKVYSTFYVVGKKLFGDFAFMGQGDYLHQSFSGELTQLNIWKSVISEETIKAIAKCELDVTGDYLSWDSGWTLYNVDSYEVDYKELCEVEKKNTFFGFSDILQEEAFYICEALGSHLPIPLKIEDVNKIFSVVEQFWSDSDKCDIDVFSPMNDIENEGEWISYFDEKLKSDQALWKGGEPNGLKFENCAHIDFDGLYDVDCATHKGCAVCEFNESVIYALRGTCELELRNIHFLAHQTYLNNLTFRGYGDYRITNENGTWQWVDISRKIVIGIMDYYKPNYPMGRRNWTVYDEICKDKSSKRELLLTHCKEEEFTCDDATCISLEKRCDLKYDCLDHSDERNCKLLSFPFGYRKDLPPRGNSKDNVLPLAMKLLVESVAVDTTLMLIRVSYFLQLTWYDNRINFINLKQTSNLNTITYETFNQLWIPTIGFMNSVGNYHTEEDKEAYMYVMKMSKKSFRDESQAEEMNMFPGKENPLVVFRKYITTFVCNFDLVLYPFDEQICAMEFQILSASKRFLAFDVNNTHGTYVGSDLLTEYQVGNLKILHLEKDDYSKIQVEIPLKRRSGYAVLNIYIPSLILLIISYVTLFFQPHIFEVRVMASLTTLLVVATLFTQVSTYLPKTSYFKMVDIWLLFCIATIFLIIIFHTLIDVTLLDSKMAIARSSSQPELTSRKLKKRTRLRANRAIGMLILLSRIIVFGLFVIFSFLYWGSILL